MKKAVALATRWLVVATIVGVGSMTVESVVGFDPTEANAQENARKKKPRRVPNMTETTFKKLAEIQELMDADDNDGAILVAKEMLERSRRYNGNELAQVHNMLAVLYYGKEDNPNTIFHYEQILAQVPDITEGMETSTIYNLAQLYFVEEEFDKSLEYIEKWITLAENPDPKAYYFMGQVYYQMQDYPQAIETIELAIQIAQDRSLDIRENWWSLLRFLYFELENWDRVVDILEILVKEFPKRAYWLQLAGVYGQEDMEDKQLQAFEAAHVAGFLETENDLMTYGGILLQNENPWRASRYMQEAVDAGIIEPSAKNLQQLGQAYQLAQEVDDAITVFEAAGKLSDDGNIYDRLSALYLEKDRFFECEQAAKQAIDKGGLRKLYNTEIVLGMCQFNQDKFTDARKTFVDARKRTRDLKERAAERQCQQWIAYIDNTVRRNQQLEAAGL